MLRPTWGMLALGAGGASHGVPGALGVPSSQNSESLENDPVEFLRRGGMPWLREVEDDTGMRPGDVGGLWARRRGESGAVGSRGRWSGVTTMVAA